MSNETYIATTVTTESAVLPAKDIVYQPPASAPVISYDTPTPTRELADPHETLVATSANSLSEHSAEHPEGHELNRVLSASSDISLTSIASDIKPKRDKEWRSTFDLLDDEELLDTHGCAISKDILIHGRIYISSRSVAFKSNILGFKTKVHFPLTSVTEVSPKMTALIIPNAIEIVHDGETTVFSTLPTRDSTLEILTTAWKTQAPEAFAAFAARNPEVETRDRSSSISSVNSTGSGSSKAPSFATAPAGTTFARPAPGSSNNNPAQAYADEMNTRTPTNGSDVQAGGKPKTKSGEIVPGQMHAATQPGRPHMEEDALDVRFATTPQKIWDLLYKSEEFTRKVWEGLGFTDIKIAPWVNNKRDYSYVKPLSGKIGPSSVICYFSDEIINEDADSWYGITTITRTPDIPSGKSFEVHSLTTLAWEGPPKGGCRMKASSRVEWSGRSMIKSIINSSSIEGQTTYNKTLADATKDAIKKDPAQFGLGSGQGDDDDDDMSIKTAPAKTSAAVPTATPNRDVGKPAHSPAVGSSSASKKSESFAADQLNSMLEDPVKLALAVLLVFSLLFNLYYLFSRGRAGPRVASTVPLATAGFKVSPNAFGSLERLQKVEHELTTIKASLEKAGVSIFTAKSQE